MTDFDRLLRACHDRGMKLVLDYVPNHSSDQHPWFIESRSSRDNPKRDWYIWRDKSEGGGPPNNWLSVFGGGAWEWDKSTGQYYLHSFLKEQPDLNWRNPEVRQAMLDVLRFWLDKGVDGFRIDALWHVMKDEQFRDNPLNPHYDPTERPALPPAHSRVFGQSGGGARCRGHDTPGGGPVRERLLIGEIYLPFGELVEYYGPEFDTGLHLPYNFHLILRRGTRCTCSRG